MTRPSKHLPTLVAAIAGIGLAAGANAASLVEIRSDGDLTKLYIDGQRGRMESSGDGDYMVIDNSRKQILMVMPSEGRAMDMSSMLRGATPPTISNASLTPVGKGPTIAGYATEQFKYEVAGRPCGSVYVSNRALRDSGAGALMDTMSRISDSAQGFGRGSGDPCERDGGAIPQALKNLGLPMRVTDANGRVDSEITKVTRGVALPPNAFNVPEGVQLQDMGAMQAQMQQSGQMSPQVLEQIRRAQQHYGQ